MQKEYFGKIIREKKEYVQKQIEIELKKEYLEENNREERKKERKKRKITYVYEC